MKSIAFNPEFAQVAWVVKDIEAAKRFFAETIGEAKLSDTFTIDASQYDGTYYGKPSDAITRVVVAYSGGAFLELIEPVSGNCVFRDFLDENPNGGIQHIAYRIPVADLDNRIAGFNAKGFDVISSFDTPIAKIVFFDTRKEIGVMTEVMGITELGWAELEKMAGVKLR